MVKVIKPSKKTIKNYKKRWGLNLKETRISDDKVWELYEEIRLTTK